MPKPSDLGNSISGKYDAWNRLVEVSDGGVLIAKFRYDGEGRRILKMFDSDSPGDPDGLDTYEHLFLSGQQVIETREGSGATPAQAETLQPKYQNIWSPRYIDSLILRDENTDADGLCDDSRVYYLADANFNVTALVDTAGNVVERYLYSPYGEVTVLDNDFSSDADGASDYNNTALYTGRTLDTPTGLMYYRARYYHAQLGRFVGRGPSDTTPVMGDMNPYADTRGSLPRLSLAFLHFATAATSCNPLGGRPIQILPPEGSLSCARKCIVRHENFHKQNLTNPNHFMGACCKKMQNEIAKRRSAGRPAEEIVKVAKAYNKWVDENRHLEECPAYRIQMACLWEEGTIDGKGGERDCCKILTGRSLPWQVGHNDAVDSSEIDEKERECCAHLYFLWLDTLQELGRFCKDEGQDPTPCPDFAEI